MKYKCLVCGQIIDNKDLCPYCGCDSSMIVPFEDEQIIEEEKPVSSEYEESVEERYYSLFNELIDVSNFSNVDNDKVHSLYLLGVNRGSKITKEEIEEALSEIKIVATKQEEIVETKYEQMTLPFVNELQTTEEEFNIIYNSLIRNLVDLSINEKDPLTKNVLKSLIGESINKTPKDLNKEKEEIIDALEFLIDNNKNSKFYSKYLEVLKTLFK